MTTFPQRRPLAWLAVLLGVNFILLSVQARNDTGQMVIRGWAVALVTPVVYMMTGSTGWVSDSINTFFRLYEAEKENQALRREISRLRLESYRLQGLSSLWERSQDLVGLKARFDFETVTASVIGRSAPFFQERILINAGTRNDIRPDSAVLHMGGVVGRVLNANLFSSEVEVITNQGAALGGIVEGSRLQGVARGDGSEFLLFDFIPNLEEIPIGAVVRTSGWDRIYPPGLPIGEVVRSVRGSMVYREIVVKPFVDSSRVEEVLAVKRPKDGELAAPAEVPVGPKAEGN